MKYIEVFKKSLADELTKRGNKCKTRTNFKNPKYDVFIFEDTTKLNEDWSDIASNK